MTNEQAFAEFQYAVNHWFKFMDVVTRCKAIELAREVALRSVGEVQHQQQVIAKAPVEACKGRGAHLKQYAGFVWMLNRETMERARVAPSEVSAYEAKGFIRRGARGN